MNASTINFAVKKAAQTLPRASQYLRLHPLDTTVYHYDGSWIISTPAATKGMIELVCSGKGDFEIMRLIDRSVLVPDIVSNKEYEVQLAVGSVDYRTYRLQSKIAAKYQFSYSTYMTLMKIENLIVLCDYNIFDDSQGSSSDGQKHLEIIPRDGTVVRDYQGNIITNPANELHYVDKSNFTDMLRRGVIVRQGHKWKLSRNYWEFKL
ncbi:hypothetical protein LCGC14_1224640 [marine sediment metagenome]|uniref:Uncharacterized protein n=1 Tax=marine sediment metagenome TaxID=412755 RepID=A0A0F9LXH0_9ZZZZ